MLSGCAVVPLSKPTPVPPERIYYTQPAMEANPAKVVFTGINARPVVAVDIISIFI